MQRSTTLTTHDAVDNNENNEEVVDIENQMLVESDKEIIAECFNSLGVSPMKVHGKPSSSRKS